jgi:hypothetical protein
VASALCRPRTFSPGRVASRPPERSPTKIKWALAPGFLECGSLPVLPAPSEAEGSEVEGLPLSLRRRRRRIAFWRACFKAFESEYVIEAQECYRAAMEFNVRKVPSQLARET